MTARYGNFVPLQRGGVWEEGSIRIRWMVDWEEATEDNKERFKAG